MPGRRERWPRASSRQQAQRPRAHRPRLLARGRAGNHNRHGRRPLTGACACAQTRGCRRVRLRTGGALARGLGSVKHGRNERRRHRLRRAGGLRGRPGRKGAAQLRRAARIARRHRQQGARAAPARCSRHPQASSACRRKSRSGAALAGQRSQITRARWVGAMVGIADGAHHHQYHMGPRMVVYQVFWRWLVGALKPLSPLRPQRIAWAVPTSVGRCCARPRRRGRWPRAKSGRCRRTGKQAIRGAALADQRRVVGAFGALGARVAHYEKCSEWR